MTRLVAETWPKMTQSVRSNLISLLGEFISTKTASVEVLMLHIYRRMTTGDISSQNLWLIDNMTELLERNKEWLSSLERQPFLLPLTVYTLLRLIPDHHLSSQQTTGITTANPCIHLSKLRLKELSLVEELVRKNFDRCAQIGRDFIRLLHGVARLEPMKRLWDDILQDISSLSSYFSSLSEILEITTPQCFTQTLIPHEMEQWVRWMMKNVHCIPRVPVHRYQDFFQRKFFSTPESQSLRVCLLRYVVTYFYPDNEMLASTLIPRWNVVSWILSQSTCPVATVNAKLALFYDWLFFKPNDCIMNLEPALLAIMNHLNPRSQLIAFSLVDFLIKIVGTYYPPMTERIVMGVRAGLEEMIRLGVVKNITPLFEFLHRSSSLDLLRSLRVLLGIEPNVALTSTAVPPMENLSRLIPEKWKSPGDTSIVSSNSISVTNSIVVSRTQATTPLTVTRSLSPVTLLTDSGPPTDPRLTRGHAAILAGAVPPNLNSTQTEHLVRPVLTTEVIPSLQQSIPNTLPQNPLPLTVSQDESKPSIIPSHDTLPLLPTLPRSSQQLTEAQITDDLDIMEINILENKPTLTRTATWSPPPIESRHIIKKSTDHEPDTPDSLEFKIDSLRRRFQDYQLRFHYFVEPVDVNSLIKQLNGPIRTALEQFRDVAKQVGLIRNSSIGLSASQNLDDLDNASYDQEQNSSVYLRSASVLSDLCESMEALVQAVLVEDSFDDLEIAGRTAAVVCELLFCLFAQRLMPVGIEWSEEHLEDCLEFPIFIPFRHLLQMNPGDPKRELLLLLLTEMQTRQPRLGYHLLFFLKISKLNDEKMSIYRNFCASQVNPNLRDSLFKDMQLLSDDNRRLFAYLLPDVFTVFSSELSDDTEFLRLIVATIDPGMCNSLISEIVRGHLNLFPNNDLTNILNASLEWNSIEQLFFWQLINAHEIPTSRFLPLIHSVDPFKHPEACSNLILLLKLEKPSLELVRALLSRRGSNDLLSMTALHFWSCPDNQHAGRFSNILCSFINAPFTSTSTISVSSGTNNQNIKDGKEKRRSSSKHQLSPEDCVDLSLILSHLDSLRRNCKNISLLQDNDIQSALQSLAVSPKLSPNLKDRFSDLLALVEDLPSTSDDYHSQIPDSLSSCNARVHINGDMYRSDFRKNASERMKPGSKGGRSLRNLDSRRAAEAEKRQVTPSYSGSSNPSRRHDRSDCQSNNFDGDSDGNEVGSATSGSSSCSSEEEESLSTSRKTRSGATRSVDKSTNKSKISGGKRLSNEVSRERKPINKRSNNRREADNESAKSEDDEDDEYEDRMLEVVVIDDESGEDSNSSRNTLRSTSIINNNENDEVDDDSKIRPSKRRKTTIKRFMLDD
ncbi:Integrator complex subunit 3 isoform 1 [Schistosoma japonicum]|uniref:Integrator complex subunit 3 isoform 1 n=1 Tax=Schistosoma japonicum TaxID=6182 RepID=A0A4Z2DMH0_SCHJA|nr:Integrator complex subunit 3 isoform 1 [Schistosoma japonicum]TNN17597.1 Integrator complex subunit 3 isoform 1 [Schistosoma japonicum]TNN17599.1 Integrator complex subunit 3 isoform 1 [Schistosoma japonicum]